MKIISSSSNWVSTVPDFIFLTYQDSGLVMKQHYATGLWPTNVVPVELARSQNHIFKGAIMPRHAQTDHRAWLDLMTSNFPETSLSKRATQPSQWAKLTFNKSQKKDGILGQKYLFKNANFRNVLFLVKIKKLDHLSR